MPRAYVCRYTMTHKTHDDETAIPQVVFIHIPPRPPIRRKHLLVIPSPLPFPHTSTHTHTAYRMPSNSPAMTELVGTIRAHAHSCTPPCPTPHKHNSRARPCNAPRAIIYTHPINQNPLSLPPGAAQNSAKITPGLSTSSIPQDQ